MRVEEIITQKIIKSLENGVIPWKKPWINREPPRNFITRKPYSGINVFLLSILGYSSPDFLTRNQIKKLNGYVKSGEKPNIVMFYKDVNEGKEEEDPLFIPRYYRVYNIEQTMGIKYKKVDTLDNFNVIEAAEEIIKKYHDAPFIVHFENEAYYRPSDDTVNMPIKSKFVNDELYYHTLFHELIHSTGHENRLARPGIKNKNKYASIAYSKEELIAEMGATFLSNSAGILEQTIEDTTAYISGWLTKLKSDPRFIIYAAADAQKAADFITKGGKRPKK